MTAEQREAKLEIARATDALATAKANFAFTQLTPAKRRVAIARDLIAMLNSRNAPVVKTGSYCDLNFDTAGQENKSLKELLPVQQKNCEVCAMGGFLLAHVARFNQVTVDDVAEGDDMIISKLSGYFSEKMLRDMECAFEGMYINFDSGPNKDCGKKWKEAIPNDKKRLLAICENLIRNKGNFKINQVPTPAKKSK